MECPHRAQVGVRQDVAVQHEQGPRHQVGRVADAAAGAERLALDDVPEPDAELGAVAERRAHVVDPVRARQDDVGHAVSPEERELVGEEGPVQERHDGLCPRERQRAQAGALPTGQDHRLQGPVAGRYVPGDQGCASLISITGMSSRMG